MAITPREKLAEAATVDPTDEAEIHEYSFQVPDSFTFRPPQGELIYDRPSDMMLILFHGRNRESFVYYVVGDYAVLLDSYTDELVGLQIEGFLISAVKDEPQLITLLDHARLLGMTVAEVRHERQRALGYRGRFKLWLERMVEAVTRRGEPHQQNAVEGILNRAQTSSIIRNALAAT